MQSLEDIRDVCHVVVHGREFMVVASSGDEAKRKAVTDCLNTRSDVGDNWDWESFERELWQHVEATKEEPKRRRGK